MKNDLISILASIKPGYNFNEDSRFISESLLDSVDIITLISEIEKKFKINIDGGEIVPENFDSINAIINLINSKNIA